jgi:hypothetical protein
MMNKIHHKGHKLYKDKALAGSNFRETESEPVMTGNTVEADRGFGARTGQDRLQL